MSTAILELPEQTVDLEVKTYGALKMAERCDMRGCGAQAFVRMVHPTNKTHDGELFQDLLWCGHHFKDVRDKLPGWGILDETHRINGGTVDSHT